jgi:drug/metabolite transporter (DMT)-like permease
LRSFEPLPAAMWRSGVAAVLTAGWLAVSAGARSRGTEPALDGEADSPGAARPADAVTPTPTRGRGGRLVRLVTLAALGGLVFLSAMNLAVAGAGATVTAFVAGLYAVLGAILGWPLLGERLSASAVAGFALALAGTGLLAELDPGRGAGGIGAGLVAAVSYALFLVLSRRWSRPFGLGPPTVSLATTGLTAVGLFVALLVAGSAGAIVPPSVRPDALVALAWLALVAVVAQVLVVGAVRRIDARRSSAFLLLNPLAATLLGAVLLGERLSAPQVLGAVLVIVGMAVGTGTVEALRDLAGRHSDRAREAGRPSDAEGGATEP